MLGNYFKENSKTIKKVSLALRTLIGTMAMSAYVSNDAKMAFWFLFAGAVIDFLLQLLPEDPKPDETAKFIILVVLVGALLSSCKITKPETQTIIKDSVSINYRTIDVPVKGATVYQMVNVDSLQKAWQQSQTVGKPTAGKPVVIIDPQSKAELKVWVDQYGKLQASCESKDQTVKALVAELTHMRQKIEKKTEIVKETPKWCYIALTILGTLLTMSVLINVFTFNKR